MGLDIYGYSNVQKINFEDIPEEHKDGRYISSDEYLEITIISGYEDRAPGILDSQIFKVGVSYGCSKSYSGYGEWRDNLARLCGYPKVGYIETAYLKPKTERLYSAGAWEATSGKCWELITFPDNEGTFGTEICKKIKEDLLSVQGGIFHISGNSAGFNTVEEFERFKKDLNNIRMCFEYGADNGIVVFR